MYNSVKQCHTLEEKICSIIQNFHLDKNPSRFYGWEIILYMFPISFRFLLGIGAFLSRKLGDKKRKKLIK